MLRSINPSQMAWVDASRSRGRPGSSDDPMLRDASLRSSTRGKTRAGLRCDAPQHEVVGGPASHMRLPAVAASSAATVAGFPIAVPLRQPGDGADLVEALAQRGPAFAAVLAA